VSLGPKATGSDLMRWAAHVKLKGLMHRSAVANTRLLLIGYAHSANQQHLCWLRTSMSAGVGQAPRNGLKISD
jgi:hypothetical protein